MYGSEFNLKYLFPSHQGKYLDEIEKTLYNVVSTKNGFSRKCIVPHSLPTRLRVFVDWINEEIQQTMCSCNNKLLKSGKALEKVLSIDI